MILNIVYPFFLLITPFIIQVLCQKFSWLNKLGPLLICYILGFALSTIKPVSNESIKSFAEVMIILAVPLFLFSTKIKQLKDNAPKMLIGFALMTISVFFASLIATFFFRETPEIASLSAGVAGVFTGGTLNLSALAIAFKMPANTFILINTVDMIAGALYFLVLLQWGKQLMAKEDADKQEFPKTNLTIKNYIISIAFALVSVGLSVGSSYLLMRKIDLRVLFIALTLFSLIISKARVFRSTNAPYFAGNYLILVFCFSLSQMIQFDSFSDMGITIFNYTISALGLTVIFFTILSKLFKIDKETATLVHISGVYGAPFVVVYSNYLKKPRLILPGIALALLGYTIGTIFGILLKDILVKLYF